MALIFINQFMVRPGPAVKKEVTSELREMGKYWALLCSFPGPVLCPRK